MKITHEIQGGKFIPKFMKFRYKICPFYTNITFCPILNPILSIMLLSSQVKLNIKDRAANISSSTIYNFPIIFSNKK